MVHSGHKKLRRITMKNFIKTILAASVLLANASLQAVSPETIAKLENERAAEEKTFPQFSQLPRDLQVQILGSINESKNLDDAVKRLAQLRLVSKQMKDFIDSPYSGKYLIQKIVDRFPPQVRQHDTDPEKKQLDWRPLLESALNLGTPGVLAWIKEQSEKDPELKNYVINIIDSLAQASMIKAWPTKMPLFLLKTGVRDKHTNWIALEYALSLEPLLSSQEAEEKELDFNGKESKKFDEFLATYNLNINQIDHQGKTILDRYEELSDYLLPRNKARFLRLKGAKTAAELRQGQ
jgi:hypothetical protein